MQLDPCVPVEPEPFRRIVSIELGTSIESQVRSGGHAGHTHVRLGCAPGGVELVVDDGVTRKTMSRVLDVQALDPSSRTRLLALATAEFVVASWIELSVRAEPAVEPVGPRPSPEAERAVRAVVTDKQEDAGASLGWDFGAAVTLTGWTSLSSLIPGAGLRVLHRPIPHFAWALSADFGLRRVDVPEGRVELALFSAAAELLVGGRAGRWELFGGVGTRFGAVRMAGVATDPSTDVGRSDFGAYGGPLLSARVLFHAHPHLRVGLQGEAGLTVLPLQLLTEDAAGNTELSLELAGAWITGGLFVAGGF